MNDPVPTGSVHVCDGGYACLAVKHIEGCFTGEGDPGAAKGLYVARLRAEVERLREELRSARTYIAPADDEAIERAAKAMMAASKLESFRGSAGAFRALAHVAVATLAGSPLVSGEPASSSEVSTRGVDSEATTKSGPRRANDRPHGIGN